MIIRQAVEDFHAGIIAGVASLTTGPVAATVASAGSASAGKGPTGRRRVRGLSLHGVSGLGCNRIYEITVRTARTNSGPISSTNIESSIPAPRVTAVI